MQQYRHGSFSPLGILVRKNDEDAAGSVTVYAKLEHKAHPDSEPSYTTAEVKVGSTPADYEIAIPAQPGKTFSVLLLYVKERNRPVTLTNMELVGAVRVTQAGGSGSGSIKLYAFSAHFGGATMTDDNTYVLPAAAEAWGGFASEDDIYPLAFPATGALKFTGSTAMGGGRAFVPCERGSLEFAAGPTIVKFPCTPGLVIQGGRVGGSMARVAEAWRTCIDGTFWSRELGVTGACRQCTRCLAGTFTSKPCDKIGTDSQCSPCSKGSYSDGPSQRQCRQCIAGVEYQDQEGKDRCKLCTCGTFFRCGDVQTGECIVEWRLVLPLVLLLFGYLISQWYRAHAKKRRAEEEHALEKKAHARTLREFEIPSSDIDLVQPLGEGNAGAIYIGHWADSDVVVKTLKAPDDADEVEIAAAFKHESHLLKSLSQHTSIVQICGICPEPGNLMMVMEYMHQGSLQDICQNDRRSAVDLVGNWWWNKRLQMMLSVSQGLNFLHNKGVLHCDVAARNIFCDSGHAKLGDFGRARMVSGEALLATEHAMKDGTTPRRWRRRRASSKPASPRRSSASGPVACLSPACREAPPALRSRSQLVLWHV